MKLTLRIHSRLKVRIVGAVREATEATLVRAAPFVIAELSRVADSELHETASLYKEGLRDAVQLVKGALKIELTGVTKDIEMGYPARDMKTDLLNSSNAKQGKNGKYVDIPFRHVVTGGASKLQGMPAQVKAKVQAAARSERVAARNQGRAERNPLRVTGTMAPSSNVQQRHNRKGKTKEVTVDHKTSVYSNMIRMKFGKSSSYSTIRRISSNSDPQSWWHPGFKGIRALKRITPDLKLMLRMVYKQELSRRGLKIK